MLRCNLSSTAVDENGIYVAVTGGNLYSLDRDTGAVQWATPLTGSFRYNGLAVANGVVYSLNDAVGTLQAFDASNGAPAVRPPVRRRTPETPMHDMGNSSGVSVARNTVFATSQCGGRQHPVRAQAGRDRWRRRQTSRRPARNSRLRTTAARPRRSPSSPPAPARRATGT